MSFDERLFDYPLQPQLLRLRWRLDGAMGALARVLAELESRRADCAALDERIAAGARSAAAASAGRLDVRLAHGALQFLAGLRARRAAAAAVQAELDRRAQALRDEVAVAQRELEKLERDRAERLQDHLRDRARLAAREADQDWTARARWRATGAGS